MAVLYTLNGPIPWPHVAGPAAQIRRAVVAALKASLDVQGVVATRVYPLAVPEGAALPALAYQLLYLQRVKNLGGPSGLAQARFQFTVASKSLSDGESGAEAVRQCLDGLVTTLPASTDEIRVKMTRLESEHDYAEDPADGTGRPVFRTVVTYSLVYLEPLPRNA